MVTIITAMTTAFLNWLAALTRQQSNAVNQQMADENLNKKIEQEMENASSIQLAQDALNQAAQHAGRDPNV